jgi:hypothetical protein
MGATAAILDFVSVDYRTNALVDGYHFYVSHWGGGGGGGRKVPFDNQLSSSKMATTAAILDLVSVEFLTNVWVDWSDFWVAHWG